MNYLRLCVISNIYKKGSRMSLLVWVPMCKVKSLDVPQLLQVTEYPSRTQPLLLLKVPGVGSPAPFSNPSTSAKPFMTQLQNLFVALVNMDIFQMTLF